MAEHSVSGVSSPKAREQTHSNATIKMRWRAMRHMSGDDASWTNPPQAAEIQGCRAHAATEIAERFFRSARGDVP